jgi:hypothetical protein
VYNQHGDNSFGNSPFTIKLQDHFTIADSTKIVNQLIYVNQRDNHGLIPDPVNYPYDSTFYGTNGNRIIEIGVDPFGLVDTTGISLTVQRICDHGYALHTKAESNTPKTMRKIIYPNT